MPEAPAPCTELSWQLDCLLSHSGLGGDSSADGSARSSYKPVCVQLRYTELLFLNVHL